MPKRLSIVGDDDPLFPIQAFFNAIGDHSFIETIARLLKGIGAGFDDVFCEFPSDLDPGEEPFEGVRCALYEDEIVVDLDTFGRFLKLACENYVREHPEDKAQIDSLLQKAS